ncbi:hypothetical protein I552_0669 [Mycobacterium xenopi 3993]|nr:hypothetical protein I552_0669 [Mycobacterium xenopi 3993]
MLAILAAGPTLSKSAALIGHDTLPADPAAVVVNEGISATTTQSAPSSTTPATAPPPPAPRRPTAAGDDHRNQAAPPHPRRAATATRRRGQPVSVRPWIPPRKPTPPPQFSMVETKVPPPSEVPEVVPAGKMQKLLPILMVIAIVGMIGIFFATGLRRMSPFMLLFPLMFLASGAGMMGGYGASGGKKTPRSTPNDANTPRC